MSFTVAEVLQPTVLTRKKNTKTSNRSEQNWLDTKFIQVPVKTKCYRFKIKKKKQTKTTCFVRLTLPIVTTKHSPHDLQK